MKQRAKELGALPTGLVRPGQVFEWPTLEPWAEPVEDAVPVSVKAELDPPVVQRNTRVTPGRSEPTRLDPAIRRRGPKQATTADDVI